MKVSIANTLANAPSERSADTRTGISVMKWWITFEFGRSYSGTALRSLPPPPASGIIRGGGLGSGSARCQPAISQVPSGCRPGRVLWVLLQSSCVQSTMLPAASSEALTSTLIAGPKGSHWNSSSRDHCSLTGRPGTARATSAASRAASSAPLWP